jgi:hypothetical protein
MPLWSSVLLSFRRHLRPPLCPDTRPTVPKPLGDLLLIPLDRRIHPRQKHPTILHRLNSPLLRRLTHSEVLEVWIQDPFPDRSLHAHLLERRVPLIITGRAKSILRTIPQEPIHERDEVDCHVRVLDNGMAESSHDLFGGGSLEADEAPTFSAVELERYVDWFLPGGVVCPEGDGGSDYSSVAGYGGGIVEVEKGMNGFGRFGQGRCLQHD